VPQLFYVRGGDFGQGHYPIGDLRVHALFLPYSQHGAFSGS
jgi:hypothetical protein